MRFTSVLNSMKYLVTGGLGQLGGRFAAELSKRHGARSVILSDIKEPNPTYIPEGVKYEQVDVCNSDSLKRVIETNDINCVVHLAALLSYVAELKPKLAHEVNIYSLYPLLALAKERQNMRVYIPSTIGAFGPESPRSPTPDICIQRPKTIYGISKVYTEHIGEYFFLKYGVDFRCLRYPGIISSEIEAGGGTTDYAVDIFREAVNKHKYTCYLTHNTLLPMMHIDDCVQSTVNFVDADRDNLKKCTYNIGAVSFTPDMVAKEIQKTIPDFTIDYEIDPIRQNIADSWPQIFDDANARRDWGHAHKYDLEMLTVKMLQDMGTPAASMAN